jgi:hypothetical protein
MDQKIKRKNQITSEKKTRIAMELGKRRQYKRLACLKKEIKIKR